MSSKRKRIVLSVAEKLKILEQLDRGASGPTLAREYGVGTSTISDIKKQCSSIRKFASALDSEDGSLKRKTMKMAENKDLESAMYTWFMQVRSQDQPISGPLICEKALEMNKRLGGNLEFKATTGWLQRFKSRHGIRELNIQGESRSADHVAAESFKRSFKDIVKNEGYENANIYNADETGLYWKKMPTKSLVAKNEKAAPGYKASKSRITAMTCANATGTHRLPLLVIGQSKNPRCFKGIKKLPLIYKNQRNAWMDTNIFIDWYDNVFIPEVKKHQQNTGRRGKVLLLVDNAPSHPSQGSLRREDGMFNVAFLPPNVTSVLQPMDQGIIETFKRFYRKQLLRRLLIDNETNESIQQLYKKLDLRDAVYMAADAWESVNETTLKKGWRKLYPVEDVTENTPNEADCNNDFVSEFTEVMEDALGFEECDNDNIQDWLNCDEKDMGYQIFTDDEIIDQVQSVGSDEEDDDVGEDSIKSGPTNDEAFHCLDTAMKWLEQQEECDVIQLLSLKRLRDLAAKKRVSGLQQKKINDFFKVIGLQRSSTVHL